MPAISIGMPVRNSASTVARTIRSVLAQSFSDWELIVIDDGSTDGTVNVVRQFADRRIRLVAGDENRGLPARLNEAIRLSASEVLARMDGDDVMYPERLRLQYEFLRENQEVDLVGGSIMVFRGNGIPLGTRGGARTTWCGTRPRQSHGHRSKNTGDALAEAPAAADESIETRSNRTR